MGRHGRVETAPGSNPHRDATPSQAATQAQWGSGAGLRPRKSSWSDPVHASKAVGCHRRVETAAGSNPHRDAIPSQAATQAQWGVWGAGLRPPGKVAGATPCSLCEHRSHPERKRAPRRGGERGARTVRPWGGRPVPYRESLSALQTFSELDHIHTLPEQTSCPIGIEVRMPRATGSRPAPAGREGFPPKDLRPRKGQT